MEDLPQFTLKRISSSATGTFGVLLEWDQPFALTVEPPWRNNQVNISCIPPGTYRCTRYKSPRFGWTFLIRDIPGRSLCVFHKGNFGFTLLAKKIKSATKGCVVVGEEFGQLSGFPALLSSRKGFKEFLKRTKTLDEFYLKIEDCTK